MPKEKGDMKDHQLDIQKTLAERNQRLLRELELNGPYGNGNDSLLPTPTLSDSLFEVSFSQQSQPGAEKKVDTFVVLNVFNGTQIFRLFNENTVNFSWLKKNSKFPDIPANLSSSNLAQYIYSEIKARHFHRSKSTTFFMCRYLFFLTSVTTSSEVLDVSAKILEEQMSDDSEPFCISVPDLLVVLMNYGTTKNKIWPEEEQVHFLPPFEADLLDCFDANRTTNLPFPRANFEKVLKLLRHNMTVYPKFCESEKACLFSAMLNLTMANFIAKDYLLVHMIKDVMASILESFSEEEWNELDYKRVEELVLQCWKSELDPVGIVQRISSIPATSLRGIQLQRCAAYFAVQHLMDFENVNLCGQVLVDDVHQLLVQLNRPTSDFRTLFCIMTLISLAIDLNEPTTDKEKFESLKRALNDVRHSIRDVTNDMDFNRLAVKDLMCEIATLWKDSITKENVV